MITACAMALCLMVTAEDEKPQDETFDVANQVAIHVFFRKTPKVEEYLYVINEESVARLKKKKDEFRYLGILGYGSSVRGEGLIKINRALRKDWHVYYTEVPRGYVLPKGTRIENFPVWVWEKKAEGLVPVYGCSAPDWRQMSYSTDRDEILHRTREYRKLTGRQLKDHGIVFYVRPAENDGNEDSK